LTKIKRLRNGAGKLAGRTTGRSDMKRVPMVVSVVDAEGKVADAVP
jgi:hypothetical protein